MCEIVADAKAIVVQDLSIHAAPHMTSLESGSLGITRLGSLSAEITHLEA